MSSENGPLISTLRSLQLKSLKEVSVGNKFATILDRPVYNALFPNATPETTEGMLEEEEWDENETLLALAARSSDRPLRAWLGVAVDHNMLTENMAAAVHRALRERYGPSSSNAFVGKGKSVSRTQPLWSPGSKAFGGSSGSDGRTPMGTLRVCRQCRRDHQRCDRAVGKQCKRCIEHGWNCAESIPKSPTSAKRKRQEDDLLAQQSPDEDEEENRDEEDDMEADEQPVIESAPAADIVPVAVVEAQPVEPSRDPSPVAPPVQQRRSISAASSSNKSRRQRSLSNASNKDEKPTLRELRTLERETQIPGSKRKRQTSAVDVALDKMGLRKTAANIAFLTEAGLISPDLDGGSEMTMEAIMEVDTDKVEQSMAVDNAETKADDDDGESATSSRDEYSFFGENGESAVGTPATISDPHLTRETSSGPVTASAAASAKSNAVVEEASPTAMQ